MDFKPKDDLVETEKRVRVILEIVLGLGFDSDLVLVLMFNVGWLKDACWSRLDLYKYRDIAHKLYTLLL